MTVYNFILAFLSAGMFFFSMYYLFTVIVIHKKIFDKHFYFSITCLCSSLYIFFQLLLSLQLNDTQYLLFHKLRLMSIILGMPFYQYLIYEFYFKNGNRFLVKIYFIITPIFIILCFLDLMHSMPINTVIVNTSISKFIYHFGTKTIFYSIWSLSFLIIFSSSIIYFLFSKKQSKRIPYLIIFLPGIIIPINDLLVYQGFSNSITLVEYYVFLFMGFIFIELLLEDRKTYLKVIELNKESQRRLRITEIYTRHSLVESIERGDDPTKFQPNNIQIATLFTDIRDFTGISEGMKPLEVVELLNAYFNRMNSTIIKHNGEIDKLMGDCIMALYKNPDDALKSAIEMRYELARFNEETSPRPSPKEREKEFPLLRGGLGRGRSLNNGIGLNYGEVIIGNIGSESKMDYTVVGDIVNTASRLEALTKYYKVPLIISEDLKNQLGKLSESSKLSESYNIRFLDEVLVKGKSNPMRIYEVFDFEPDEIKEIKERNVEPLAEAFSFYQAGVFEKAIEIYSSDDCQPMTASHRMSSKTPSFISSSSAAVICNYARKRVCSRNGMEFLSLWISKMI
ncbi:MAG: adenylate/guanylate cyclase [Ignavibacteria bacterium]|nr:adenylate/guanylate cyclase [Ignavibacteria bacterium]